MPPGLWECIERQPGLAAVRFDWGQLLGEEYARIENYLRPTDRKVTTIPCRVGCTPWCRRRVVRHGPDDVVAICDEGDLKYALDEMELVSHELNLGAMCRDLCGVLALEPAVEQVAGLHQTWQCGFLKSQQGVRNPVYLSIQMEDHHLVEVALRLSAMNRTPMVLLLPTTRRVSDVVRHVLETNQAAWAPLDRTVGWSAEGLMIAEVNLAEMLTPASPQVIFGITELSPAEIGDKITIERREMAEGVHWIVGGVDKGVVCSRGNTKRTWILDTLFEGIGHGWIVHPIFIKHLQMSEGAYFGTSAETGSMQKQLTRLRKALGVKIDFSKKHGVRFAEGIVRIR